MVKGNLTNETHGGVPTACDPDHVAFVAATGINAPTRCMNTKAAMIALLLGRFSEAAGHNPSIRTAGRSSISECVSTYEIGISLVTRWGRELRRSFPRTGVGRGSTYEPIR
jgi:hypothetical protein